jgi:hypothetical protein
MASPELITCLTVAVCMATFWACICRLNQMDRSVGFGTRGRYALLLTGSLAGAASPWLAPGAGLLTLAVSLLLFLLLTLHRWRNGPPADVCTRSGALDEHDVHPGG